MSRVEYLRMRVKHLRDQLEGFGYEFPEDRDERIAFLHKKIKEMKDEAFPHRK